MFPRRNFSSLVPQLGGVWRSQSVAEEEVARCWIKDPSGKPDSHPCELRASLSVDVHKWQMKEKCCGCIYEDESWLENRKHDPDVENRAEDRADNPVTFSLRRKVCICTSIVLMTAMSLMAYTVISGTTDEIVAELNVEAETIKILHGSIYLFGVACGAMFMAPLSEMFGRLPIYHTCNVGFIFGNLACSWCTASGWLLFFQTASGFCGSCPLVLGGATIRDIVYAEEQCHNKALWSIGRLCPLFGYVAAQFGTVVGKMAIRVASWQNVFRCLGAAAAAVGAVSVILLKETYAPKLQPTDSGQFYRANRSTINRPFRRLDSEATLVDDLEQKPHPFFPSLIVIILSVYTTISNSYIYLLGATLPQMLVERFSPQQADPRIGYVGIGTGMAVGLVYLLCVYPRFAMSTKASHGLESLLSMAVPAACATPVATFVYGWSLHHHLNAVIPVIATAVIGAAYLTTFVPIQIYLIDLFTINAASAVAPCVLLQNLAGCGCPLLVPVMLDRVGIAWSSSILGCVSLMSLPFPFLFVKYGHHLR